VIVAVLGLGIGANSVLFGVIDAKVLRPLPYSEPDRLVQIWEVDRNEGDRKGTVSPYNFADWTIQSRSFDSMAVYAFSDFALAETDSVQRMIGVKVSGDYFTVLGVPALLGRTLEADDERSGVDRVVLSHRAWQWRFAGDPDIVGAKLTLDGTPYTVVGVMPPEFRFPNAITELWTTPAFDLRELDRGDHFLFGLGRLKPDVALAEASADMDAIAERLARRFPSSNEGFGVLLVPLHEAMFGDLRHDLLLLWGGVALVLIITCVNVGNLILARTVSRRGEVAVRFALGGNQARIVRQFFTESLVLAVLGGAAGLAAAAWGTHYLASGHGPWILRSEHLQLDGRVLAFNAAVTLVTALLFGIVPALDVGRSQVRSRTSPLRQGGWQMARQGWRQSVPKVLVAIQVSLAVVLLTAAGLLFKSLYLLQQVDAGFDPQGLLTMRLSVPASRAPTPTERAEVFQQVVERIEAVAGVEGAAGVNDLPFSGSRTRVSFDILGRSSQPEEASRNADFRLVVGDYFEVLGIELLRGRTFEPQDGARAQRVAVINEELARRFFADLEPLGKILLLDGKETRIVGVVDNLKHESLAADDAAEIYVPVQQGQPPERLFLAVRSQLGWQAVLPALRSAVWQVVPDQPLHSFQTLEDRLLSSLAPRRFNSQMFSAAAGVALVLVLLGTYGLVSYASRQRLPEVAVRIALGGQRDEVIRLLVLSGMAWVAAGIVVGLALAVVVAHTLRALLYGIGPTDPGILLAVPLLLAAAAAVASYFPARRATAVDPAATLLRDGQR
jgi:predicted permease